MRPAEENGNMGARFLYPSIASGQRPIFQVSTLGCFEALGSAALGSLAIGRQTNSLLKTSRPFGITKMKDSRCCPKFRQLLNDPV